MKSNYLILSEEKLIVESISGIVTLDEFNKRTQHLMSNSDISSDYRIISDMSQAIFDLSSKESREFYVKKADLDLQSAALIHKASKGVYEYMLGCFRFLFPIKHLYSVQLEDLLRYLGVDNLKREIEQSFDSLHKKPQLILAK